MTIVVFGAGAVGSFFGGLLARAGADVSFITRGAQLDAMRANGLTIQSTRLGEIHIAPLRVFEHVSAIGPADLVLVCVKAHQTAAALADLAPLVGERTILVTLQNGVESDEVIADRFGRGRVVPGVVYVGATIEAPGIVSHVAAGTIAIGSRGGIDSERLIEIHAALAAAGERITIVDDIQAERWRKLVWNASFNTVSAATGHPPGVLLSMPETRALLVGIMREVIAVGRAHGVALDASVAEEQIAWTERAGAIRTSMMVDRERGREMEIDALIGVVVRLGKAHGVPIPISESMLAVLNATAAT